MYELQAPLMVLINRKYQNQQISQKELKNQIKQVIKYLQEAFLILSKEPENSVEGNMAQASKEALKALRL